MTIENELATDDTSAQGSEATDTQVQAPGVEEGNRQGAGIQKRIDQLTAKIYERDAIIAKMQESQTSLMAKLAERLDAPPAAPVQREPSIAELLGENSDPNVARAVEAVAARLEQSFNARLGGIQAQLAGSAVQQLAARTGVNDPAVVQQAEANARKFNLAPDVAMKFTLGEIEYAKRLAGPRDERGRFAAPNMVQGGGNLAPPSTSQTKPLPSNFSALSPDRQLAELEARGLDDMPL